MGLMTQQPAQLDTGELQKHAELISEIMALLFSCNAADDPEFLTKLKELITEYAESKGITSAVVEPASCQL